jgi:hypothetical protein
MLGTRPRRTRGSSRRTPGVLVAGLVDDGQATALYFDMRSSRRILGVIGPA